MGASKGFASSAVDSMCYLSLTVSKGLVGHGSNVTMPDDGRSQRTTAQPQRQAGKAASRKKRKFFLARGTVKWTWIWLPRNQGNLEILALANLGVHRANPSLRTIVPKEEVAIL